MDFFTDICVYTLFLLYEIYAQIIGVLAYIFMPVTKWIVKRKIRAVGLEINGPRDIDPQITNDNLYVRIAKYWSEGHVEGWIQKEWEVKDFLGCVTQYFKSGRVRELEPPLTGIFTWFNLQTRGKAYEIGVQHYDMGPDLSEPMLGKTMQYSCAYWKDAKTLDEAQEAKLHLIAKKLQLKPGMRLLDIGSGWGSLAKFMATNYGVSVVGYTVAKEQKKYCEKLCRGLPCEFKLADYRTINEKFDAIVSVGMFEHVGQRNYGDFFKTANRCLKDDGLCLIQTMGLQPQTPHNSIWIHKHIFTNGYLPYQTEVTNATEGLFVIEDWHNMGYYYYLTFKAWHENVPWAKVEAKYGERFRRLWEIYLVTFMGMFKSRQAHLWQIVMSKNGLEGGYESIR